MLNHITAPASKQTKWSPFGPTSRTTHTSQPMEAWLDQSCTRVACGGPAPDASFERAVGSKNEAEPRPLRPQGQLWACAGPKAGSTAPGPKAKGQLWARSGSENAQHRALALSFGLGRAAGSKKAWPGLNLDSC